MKVTIELVQVECCVCHTTFAMTEELHDRLLNTRPKVSFYCPQGHGQSYTGETEAQKLRRLLTSAEQDREFYRANLEARERSLSATRGVVTKLRKRVTAGTCPFGCRRHFADLERHVGTKHAGKRLEGESEPMSTSDSGRPHP